MSYHHHSHIDKHAHVNVCCKEYCKDVCVMYVIINNAELMKNDTIADDDDDDNNNNNKHHHHHFSLYCFLPECFFKKIFSVYCFRNNEKIRFYEKKPNKYKVRRSCCICENSPATTITCFHSFIHSTSLFSLSSPGHTTSDPSITILIFKISRNFSFWFGGRERRKKEVKIADDQRLVEKSKALEEDEKKTGCNWIKI